MWKIYILCCKRKIVKSVFFTAPGVKLLFPECPFPLFEDLAELVFGHGKIFPVFLFDPAGLMFDSDDPACVFGKEDDIFFNSFSMLFLQNRSVQTVAVCKHPAAEKGLRHLGFADLSGCHAAESVTGELKKTVHKCVLSFLVTALLSGDHTIFRQGSCITPYFQ
jgi:hypothetical protein